MTNIKMKFLVASALALILSGCATSNKNSYSLSDLPVFHLSIDESQVVRRQAKMEIVVPSRVTQFVAPPHYGGGPLFLNYVYELKAIDAKGNPLPVTVNGNIINVKPSWSSYYTLSYSYNVPQKLAGEVDQSLPTLDGAHGRFDNNVTFPMPEGLADSKARLIISAPEKWQVATSWGKGRDFSVSKTSLLIAGTEAMGAYEYSEAKIGATSVTFALWGDFSHKIIRDQFAKVLAAQQDIVGPFPFPQLLVIFQPTKMNSAKGTALTNALVVNIPLGTKLEPFNFQVIGTISHELFHQWNFAYVRPASEEGAYLFSEGFTNYFAVAALVRAKLIPEQKFARFLWRYRTDLEKNRNYPTADFAAIQSGFSNDNGQLAQMAYVKGPFVAVLLDLALREDTGGEKSLSTWFRALMDQYGGRRGYDVSGLRSALGSMSKKPTGNAVQVFDEDFVGHGKLDLKGLFRRFGIHCSSAGECSLNRLTKADEALRSKVFSARM